MDLTAKAETKKAVIHNLGCEADDWLENAKKQVAGFDGAKQALYQSAKQVQSIAEFVTKDLDDGKLGDMGPLEIADYAKLQISRAVESLKNAARNFESRQLSAIGEVAAYEKLVKHYTKLHETEESRIKQIQEALASGEITVEDDESMSQSEVTSGSGPSRRIPGTRPASGIAAQRRAEDAATSTEGEVEAPPKKATKKVPSKKSSKSSDWTCGNCGKKGHTARGCPEKKV